MYDLIKKISLRQPLIRKIILALYESGQSIARAVENLSRDQKKFLFYVNDLIIFLLSLWFAFDSYFGGQFNKTTLETYQASIYLIFPVKFIVFSWLGMYGGVLRYTQTTFLKTALQSVLIAQAIFISIGLFLGIPLFPRTVQVLDVLVTLFLVMFSRQSMRWLLYKFNPSLRLFRLGRHHRNFFQPVIIYGAGKAGFELSHALRNSHTYKVKAFVDDDSSLRGSFVDGIRVFEVADLEHLVEKYKIKTVLLAIPSASNKRKQEIVSELKQKELEVKTVPAISDLISGKFSINQVRDIDITDLLGRPEVLPDPTLLTIDTQDKNVLVTGAGGSIGSELCRQIALQKPRLLVLYELNELALYTISTELTETYPDLTYRAYLGSITDQDYLESILNDHQIETIYHAAAYKHVPLVEINPYQGVINNVYGTYICTQAALRCRVKKFVLISTDKAVRPTNIMGTTKRIAELILQALAKQEKQETRFIMVRFGNVLNSSGSVIPRFRKQIQALEPITITHPEMTRYFMSIPEAARLVIQAGALGQGGEVFLLDMGEPVKILNLAHQMIQLSGLEPGEDIDIVITGLRPGEKLYEELLIDQKNACQTRHPKICMAEEAMLPWDTLLPYLEKLFLAAQERDQEAVMSLLTFLVPEYQPPHEKNGSR